MSTHFLRFQPRQTGIISIRRGKRFLIFVGRLHHELSHSLGMNSVLNRHRKLPLVETKLYDNKNPKPKLFTSALIISFFSCGDNFTFCDDNTTSKLGNDKTHENQKDEDYDEEIEKRCSFVQFFLVIAV
jgi:hypothetical protein